MKLIAIDMDGTLLNDDNIVSKQQSDYLLELIESGEYEIVISTGRLIDGVKNLLPQKLYDSVYIIALNGGIILDKDKSILMTQTLRKDEISMIFEIYSEYVNNFAVLDKQLYYRLSNENHKYMDHEERLNRIRIKKIDQILLERLNIFKTVLFFHPDEKKGIIQKLKKLNQDNINYVFSQPYLLEFLPKSVHKGNALLFLANKLNIDIKNTIAVGDGLNDITMMEMAGISIAMENSVNEIIEKSDYISSSNNDNGVMKGLIKYLSME